MLRDDICEFMSFLGCKTLNEMVEKVREREMELEFHTRQKPEQVQTIVGQAKILRPLILLVGASRAVTGVLNVANRTIGLVE